MLKDIDLVCELIGAYSTASRLHDSLELLDMAIEQMDTETLNSKQRLRVYLLLEQLRAIADDHLSELKTTLDECIKSNRNRS